MVPAYKKVSTRVDSLQILRSSDASAGVRHAHMGRSVLLWRGTLDSLVHIPHALGYNCQLHLVRQQRRASVGSQALRQVSEKTDCCKLS